jgi:tRNA pseudouridine38-40 synthase
VTLFEAPDPQGDEAEPLEARPDATAPVEGVDDGGPSQVVRLVVAYDGAGFRGFARQPGTRTVGGVLAESAAKVLRGPVELVCAGRTDAGVHAWAQVVSMRVPTDEPVDTDKLARAVTRQLGPEVVVRACDVVADDFDARRGALWRRYRYLVVNRPVPDPALARTSWWVDAPLDIHRLRLAADPFVGEHDFACFCRKGPEGSTTQRTVLESRWTDLGDGLLRYEITARAFCWQMVRSVVATIVEAGKGRVRPGEVLGMLRDPERPRVSVLAPAHGLTLWAVGYDGWSTDEITPNAPPA